MSDGRTQSVTFIAGHVSPATGGPYQTLRGYRRALEAAGVATHFIGPARPGFDFRVWLRVFRDLLGDKSETWVVLGVWHPAYALAWLASWPRRRRHLALIPTQSLSPIDWQKHRRVKSFCYPFIVVTLGRYDRIVFASDGERNEARPTSGGRARVVHHPLTLESDDVPPLRNARSGLHAAILGRVAPQKDHALAIKALAHLPGWNLHVIGSGPDDFVAELVAETARLGISDRVVWHGWMEHDRALDQVATCAVTIVASQAENYCHAAVESMLVGTPVVMVDRIASSIDFSRAGVAVVCPASPREIARTVQGLVADETRVEGLRGRARAFALRQAGAEALEDCVRAVLDFEPDSPVAPPDRHTQAGRQ